MSVLFTKEGGCYYSYDENFKEIASRSSGYVRGEIVFVSDGVLFTKDGSRYYSYDKNFREIASRSSGYVRGEIVS